METSELQAVANYNGTNIYFILYTGDILEDEWDRADLSTKNEIKKSLSAFDVAILLVNDLK